MTDLKKELQGGCEIRWAPEGGRARKVVSRSNHRVTGKFPSWKTGRMVQWESKIERDAFLLLMTDTSVRQFREQPAKLSFYLNGSKRIHFPDIYAETDLARGFFEIKPEAELNDPDIILRTNYLRLVLPTKGFFYELLGESEIRKQPRLKNATFLHLHSRLARLDLLERERIRKAIDETSGISIDALRNGILGAHGLKNVCRMIQEGYLGIDINTHWDGSTLIYMTKQMTQEGRNYGHRHS